MFDFEWNYAVEKIDGGQVNRPPWLKLSLCFDRRPSRLEKICHNLGIFASIVVKLSKSLLRGFSSLTLSLTRKEHLTASKL